MQLGFDYNLQPHLFPMFAMNFYFDYRTLFQYKTREEMNGLRSYLKAVPQFFIAAVHKMVDFNEIYAYLGEKTIIQKSLAVN